MQHYMQGQPMDHLQQFLKGISCLWRSFEPRPYPSYRGFDHDARALHGDMAAIGAGLRKAVEAATPASVRGKKPRVKRVKANAR